MAIEGGCRCGAVRYVLAVDRLPATYACHCHQCQRWTGSAFSQQAPVAETALSVTGPVVERRLVTGEGAGERTSHQRFCQACGSRLYNTNSRRPGIAMLRAGTLDRSEELVCAAHIFTASRQRWFALPDDARAWEGMPPPEALMALVAGNV